MFTLVSLLLLLLFILIYTISNSYISKITIIRVIYDNDCNCKALLVLCIATLLVALWMSMSHNNHRIKNYENTPAQKSELLFSKFFITFQMLEAFNQQLSSSKPIHKFLRYFGPRLWSRYFREYVVFRRLFSGAYLIIYLLLMKQKKMCYFWEPKFLWTRSIL